MIATSGPACFAVAVWTLARPDYGMKLLRGASTIYVRHAEPADAAQWAALGATAYRALGFEEVEIIRCFRKSLPSGAAT